ncbi:J domain-containing protein [Methylocystis sp. JAN1]|uniref:J domain-containing protein n=1 Tax=Methylocystis sp. JAN1 TaxID=3397211 RepID=UPI003FA2F6EA
MADKEEWVVWNGSLGVLVMAGLGRIEEGEEGRSAWLAPPYDVVGPFSLDDLEALGRIAFGECLVMSRRRWREDQTDLRMEGRKKRAAFQFRFAIREDNDAAHREALDLPAEGALEASEVNAAFRRLAKRAHPDAGGSNEDYRRIAAARDALLDRLAHVS